MKVEIARGGHGKGSNSIRSWMCKGSEARLRFYHHRVESGVQSSRSVSRSITDQVSKKKKKPRALTKGLELSLRVMRSIWRSLKKTRCNEPTVWKVPLGCNRKAGHKKANRGERKINSEAVAWVWSKILSRQISSLNSVMRREGWTVPETPSTSTTVILWLTICP